MPAERAPIKVLLRGEQGDAPTRHLIAPHFIAGDEDLYRASCAGSMPQ